MAVFVIDASTKPQGSVSPAATAEPSSILSRLRVETRGEHEAVERVLDLLSDSLTRQGYRQRLEQFYGFYAPLEVALQAHCKKQPDELDEPTGAPLLRSALGSRLDKSSHLRQDLQHLGVTIESLPLCQDLPPLDTLADAGGCLYVLEGATLGGRMITRHIQARLGITPATGGRFFEGYGADTGTMWRAMRQMLAHGGRDTQTENAMVASALATFVCLRRWCEIAPTPIRSPCLKL